MANKWESISASSANKEELQAIAAQQTDATGVNHSINDAITILIREHKERQPVPAESKTTNE